MGDPQFCLDLRTFNGLSSIPAMLDFLEETYGYDFTER